MGRERPRRVTVCLCTKAVNGFSWIVVWPGIGYDSQEPAEADSSCRSRSSWLWRCPPLVRASGGSPTKYKRELRLTPEQSKQLEEVFQAAVPTLKSLKKALDQAESEFERLVERGDDGP